MQGHDPDLEKCPKVSTLDIFGSVLLVLQHEHSDCQIEMI